MWSVDVKCSTLQAATRCLPLLWTPLSTCLCEGEWWVVSVDRWSTALATWRSNSTPWTSRPTTAATRMWGWWRWATRCRRRRWRRSRCSPTCLCSAPPSTSSSSSWMPGEAGRFCPVRRQQTTQLRVLNDNVTCSTRWQSALSGERNFKNLFVWNITCSLFWQYCWSSHDFSWCHQRVSRTPSACRFLYCLFIF